MSPERAERIRRGVAGAPPLSTDALTLLRQLLPPATPVTRTNNTRQEVAA